MEVKVREYLEMTHNPQEPAHFSTLIVLTCIMTKCAFCIALALGKIYRTKRQRKSVALWSRFRHLKKYLDANFPQLKLVDEKFITVLCCFHSISKLPKLDYMRLGLPNFLP